MALRDSTHAESDNSDGVSAPPLRYDPPVRGVAPWVEKGDGDDFAPAAAAPAKAAPAAAAPAAAPKAQPKQQRDSAPRQQRQPRTQGDRELNAAVPAGEDAKEDRAKSFARGGGRGGRGGVGRGPGANPRGNGGTYLGGNRPRRENGGGRPFDRHSQTGRVDSEKAEAAGWGAEDGKKELEAEQLGDADAKAEKPAADGTATPVREAPIEEEDNTQTYEEYLAAQAEKKLSLSLPEARKANEGDESSLGKPLTKKSEAEEEWLFGAPKASSGKAKKQKEGKQFLEVEFTSAPRKDTRERTGPTTRGRGGARGRGEGRGRGGAARGGATRGASSRGAVPAVPDASAFPALA
ncbi:hypothetical protein DMC30DRAFT_415662 [Rhodotorula diobovata]|uniref:Hyaluronan/mRNA-binding protein domain-containing protein n=1 Tax=Rhodotorula diobovata TaxID=5288 RepID=A0A5C5FY66_9BASI|nr:hypothetical protein DMC30DRAFT_415662 [Rhodotorula diobovata]